MTTAQTWEILGTMVALVAIMLSVMMFLFRIFLSEFKDFKTEVNARFESLETEVKSIAGQVAEMDGKLDVVVRQAHTHEPVSAASSISN
jgi:peptidoglycan hydrolase CwlO-like protein